MNSKTFEIRCLWLLMAFCLTVLAAGQTSQNLQRPDSASPYPKGSYWDTTSTEHPTCAGLVARHYALTQQLEETFDRARSTPAPKQSQVVDEMNKLAKERNEIARQITECVKQSTKARGTRQPDEQVSGAENGQGEGTILTGGVEEEVFEPGVPGVPANPVPPLRPGVPVLDKVPIPGRVETGNIPTIPGGVGDGGNPPQQPNPTPPPQQPRPNRPRPPTSGGDQPHNDPRRAPRPVFTYYYINGINTPLEGEGRGNTAWDRKLIAGNLLSIGPRVGRNQNGRGYAKSVKIRNEVDRLGPVTHNPSGKDPLGQYHPIIDAWINSFCEWEAASTRGVTRELAGQLCFAANWIRNQKGDWLGGQAAGDLLECARQALDVFPGQTGIRFSASSEVVRQVTDDILDTYKREEDSGSTNYFIVVAHSQGNFFGEGVAYRLSHLWGADQEVGREIFERRLGIVSLASPSSYDSLPQSFRERRIAHFTRKDDAIVALRQLGGSAKRPWPASDDLPPVWNWKAGFLEKALRIAVPGVGSPILDAVSMWPPASCGCSGPDAALYVPLLNSHLLENYLADPPLAEQGRTMNEGAAAVIGLERSVTPAANPVLGKIRFGLFQLKQELLSN